MATGLQHAVKAVRDAVGLPLPEAVMRKPREEGTVSDNENETIVGYRHILEAAGL